MIMDGQGFTFRQFDVRQDMCAMKVGTDGVLLGAWAAGGRRILDIGTGTGLVALMMAQRFEGARVCGIDIDDGACRQAMANVAGSPFAARIEICHSRLQDFLPSVTFDSIVSNPPFFTNSLKCPDARRSAARHADTLPFADLFRGVARLLDADGVFSAVIPADAEGDFSAEASFSGLVEVRRCLVRTTPRKAPKRVLLSFARHRTGACETEEVAMLDGDGNKSEWYRGLTDEFYLK